MSQRFAYFRVSTGDQSIEAQRTAMEANGPFDREFADEGVSGATLAASRPDFARLLEHVREGDTVCVAAIDRLGRDAIDVQTTVRDLLDRGVTVDVKGLGAITGDVGKIIVAVLAQVADMERNRIRERTADGRATARKALAETGRTHRGKLGLGRQPKEDGRTIKQGEIAAWRKANKASIAQTAAHFDVSEATVKRYCAASNGG